MSTQKERIENLENNVSELVGLVKQMIEPEKKKSTQKSDKLPEKRDLFSFSGNDFTIEESYTKKKDHRYFAVTLETGSAIVKRTDKLNGKICRAISQAFTVLADYYDDGNVNEQFVSNGKKK